MSDEDDLKQAFGGHCGEFKVLVQFRSPMVIAMGDPKDQISPGVMLAPRIGDDGEPIEQDGKRVVQQVPVPPLPMLVCKLRVKGVMLELEYEFNPEQRPKEKCIKLVHPGDVLCIDRVELSLIDVPG